MNTSLENFKKENPTIQIIEETEHYNLKNLWGDSSFICRFENKLDFTSLDSLFLPRELWCSI